MAHTSTPSIVITDLSLRWPDGSTALHGVSASFGSGRTGLTGLNGSGKSTLLRLIAGELTPTTGTVTTSDAVAYLPQSLPLAIGSSLADALGIERKVHALHAIYAGEASAENFEALADDWGIVERAQAALSELGFTTEADLDRPVETLSGGEAVLAGIDRLRLADAPIALLDEPTNNLDRRAWELLYSAVRSWRGALVVVSHDRDLLDLMDDTAELRSAGIRIFGGNYSAFTEQVLIEQEAAERMVRSAEHDLREEKRQRAEAEVKLARRERFGRTAFENKREPKIVMNAASGPPRSRLGSTETCNPRGWTRPASRSRRLKLPFATTTASASTCQAPSCLPGEPSSSWPPPLDPWWCAPRNGWR